MGKSALHAVLRASALALGSFASTLQAAPKCGVDYSVNALTDTPSSPRSRLPR